MPHVRHVTFRAACLTAALLAAAPAVAQPPAAEIVPPPSAGAAAPAGAAPQAPAADVGYALGYRIGRSINADHEGMGIDVDRAMLARGLADAVTGAKPALDEARFAQALAAFQEQVAKRQAEFAVRMKEAAAKNLATGREFLAANAKRPGVVVRPSGLQYEVREPGSGAAPGPNDVVVARYRGTRIDGTEFDATQPAEPPASFALGEVVPGWQEALPLMKAGAKWTLWLPPELAYGKEGSPPVIGPNEVLVFDIELIRTEPGPAPARP
ncbi:MAG: FKBP-type peptidyl-prolyl cis-trans isomerase [Planctomycetaceae bacterium]